MKESHVPESIMRMEILLGPDLDDNKVKPVEYREICPNHRTTSGRAIPGTKGDKHLEFADFDQLNLPFLQKYYRQGT